MGWSGEATPDTNFIPYYMMVRTKIKNQIKSHNFYVTVNKLWKVRFKTIYRFCFDFYSKSLKWFQIFLSLCRVLLTSGVRRSASASASITHLRRRRQIYSSALSASASNLLICGVGVNFTHLRRRRQIYSSAASASNLPLFILHIFSIYLKFDDISLIS